VTTLAGGSSSRAEIILAFDYGARRIGVASGNTLTRTAEAVAVLDSKVGVDWLRIAALVNDYAPSRFVVGLPLNMDGTPTLLTDAARAFACELKQRFGAPAALVDERLSSREAEAQLREARATGLKRRRTQHGDIDKIAARILLERWFDNPAAAERV
jgi:putative holliday junction resolvase